MTDTQEKDTKLWAIECAERVVHLSPVKELRGVLDTARECVKCGKIDPIETGRYIDQRKRLQDAEKLAWAADETSNTAAKCAAHAVAQAVRTTLAEGLTMRSSARSTAWAAAWARRESHQTHTAMFAAWVKERAWQDASRPKL